MANSAQAKKRARQATKRRVYNVGLRSKLRTAIKSVRKAILSENQATAQGVFNNAMSTIDSIAGKGIIHKNKAARCKSRLNAAIKLMS
ncbi:MAG: 30S ribosomal protein S20 [Nitrosomonas sp.]|nr:MAG: 30S ribosomal protein S20 [Nitrosomonas sp.]